MIALLDCRGQKIDMPTFDPFVANHLTTASSLTDTLINQINGGMYSEFFGKSELTFLDLGANVGLVSLYAAPACKRIVALEPAPDTFTVLQAMTQKYPQIEAVRGALTPTDGPQTFFVNDINTTASSTVNTYGTKTTVPGWTLASILSIHQLESVDVCKVDCEGAEGESLTFAQLEQAAPVIKSYFIETHNCPKDTWEEKLGRLIRDLSRLGYHKMNVEGMALIASKST